MIFRLRDIRAESKYSQQLELGALTHAIPRPSVLNNLAELGVHTIRERKLSLETTLWLMIAMNLYSELSLESVLEELYHGLRLLWPDEATENDLLIGKSSIAYRRAQLGARPLRELFHQICKPIATETTRGAFLKGLRLMAIDGFTEDVLDTKQNARAFGRHYSDRGESAFPQVLSVALCECGTHCMVDAIFRPANTSEHPCALRLVRSVEPGMLVMFDRGLHDYKLIKAILNKGGHVLSRLSTNLVVEEVRRLPDGSRLCRLRHPDSKRRRQGEHLMVRVIEYTLNDPQLPQHGQKYRLLTTLLDEERFGAHTLASAYHERWEFELSVDEIDTHQLEQHHPSAPLRSRHPFGVIQELYGLLLAHYAVRFLMHEAALQADLDPDELSFISALRVIKHSARDFQIASPDLLPQLYQRLLRRLARESLPEREPRSNPRVVKRKVIKWPLKRELHQHCLQPTRPFWAAVVLI